VQEDTRSSLPLWYLSSFFLIFCWRSGDAGLVGILRNSGVFVFLSCIRLVGIIASRTNCRSKTSGRRKQQTRKEKKNMSFSPNSTSNKTDKTPHVVLTHRTSTYLLQPTMDCVFLSCSVCLSWASLGRERAMTSQLFCLSLAFGNIQGWSRNHIPLRLNKTCSKKVGRGLNFPFPLPAANDTTHDALGRTHFPFVKKHNNPDGHGCLKEKNNRGYATTPAKKKKGPAWCLQQFRRAE